MTTNRSLLEVGSIIQDNDVRMKGRRLIIKDFSAGMATTHSHVTYAVCDNYPRPFRQVRINVERIHTDGKPRRSGFSLVMT